jgi:fluoride ion exporter CrcB/FEX
VTSAANPRNGVFEAVLEVSVGVIGGVATRWAVGGVLGDVATLVAVNSLGACIFGRWVFGQTSPRRRRLVGVGFCGGLTTMSSVAVAIAYRLDAHRWLDATVVACAVGLGAAAGFVIGRQFHPAERARP